MKENLVPAVDPLAASTGGESGPIPSRTALSATFALRAVATVALTCLMPTASLIGYHRLSFGRTSNHPPVPEAPA